MSKYTTEVRYICEYEAGYKNSVGVGEVENVLENSWNKIFTGDVIFFDESYRKLLCKKILRHYYLREIGSETVGIWKLWMNTKLAEIMPYYNKLYESELLKFNPLYNTDLSKTHNRKENTVSETDTKTDSTTKDTEKTGTVSNDESNTHSVNTETGTFTDAKTGKITDAGKTSSTENSSGNTTDKNRYSDTPQGSLSNIENNSYLTNATLDDKSYSDSKTGSGTSGNTRNITENNTNTANRTNTTDTKYTDENTSNTERELNSIFDKNENSDSTVNTIEDFTEKVIGNSGENYSEMLLKFRETFLNIDLLVIDEFRDLFFGLW